MLKKTSLNQVHHDCGARMVEFGGWEMPIHYGSQIEEHHAVRREAGMFDVSHMTVVDLRGEGVTGFLRQLLANDVGRLKSAGKALYSCMLNEQGGVIDDLIVYRMSDDWYRMVVNASTREQDLAWIRPRAQAHGVAVTERDDLAMIAVQGPLARDRFAGLLAADRRDAVLALGRFSAAAWDDLFVARTGYTGEDGFEVVMPAPAAAGYWRRLVDVGVRPCGLGARDTLRLEAGMNLYGQDMDQETTPLESGLAWTVAWEPADRQFIGREALARQQAGGVPRKLVGLLLEGRGVLRHGQRVDADGEVTSGSYSPTLERSIGFARVPAATGDAVAVDIRGKALAARVVKPPFVRDGKACIDID